MIRRKQPMKRTGWLKKSGRVKPITKQRSSERKEYNAEKLVYLEANPFCEIFCAVHRINVRAHLKDIFDHDATGPWKTYVEGKPVLVPRANQIHHRNKARKGRLLDKRWWMAASPGWHQWAEDNKEKAREIGILLPFQADAEGRWGADQQAITTEELLRVRALE